LTDENNGKTYRFDVCGECKSVCCQDAKPPLTEKRQKIVKAYLEEQKISINQPFTKEQYSYPTVDAHLYCRLFNKETKKCFVHPVKPETCRAGPITFDINFKTKKLEYFLKKAKICALASVLYENPAMFKVHFEAAKLEIKQLVEQLSADELRAIVKIDEPDTFKVGEDDLSLDVIRKLGLT
jgi:Fe-S-cluster containining protein